MNSRDAKIKYQQASELYAKKDYGAALALLEEMLEAFPENAELQRVRAKVVRAMEQGQTAEPPTGTHHAALNRKTLLGVCAAVLPYRRASCRGLFSQTPSPPGFWAGDCASAGLENRCEASGGGREGTCPGQLRGYRLNARERPIN